MSFSSDPALLDARRSRIFDALAERNAVVAGEYRMAIRLLSDPAEKGDERARVSMVGNAMREVMNSLPSVLGENSRSGNLTALSAMGRSLSELLSEFPDLDLMPEGNDESVGIPRKVAKALHELSSAAATETRSIRDDVASLLTEGGANHPAVNQWMRAREFFVRCTHLQRPPRPDDLGSSDAEILLWIRVVEDLIETTVLGFFDAYEEVKDLLAEVNGKTPPDGISPIFQQPTDEQVQQVLRRITTYQLRRAFFEKLDNPLWVKPLFHAGIFAPPEDSAVDPQGYVLERFWTEGTYLSRMALVVPTEVVDALVGFGATTNGWARRIVSEIGSRVPADQAARLIPVVLAWRKSSDAGRADPRHLAEMAKNLLDHGFRNEGMKLANQLFRPREAVTPRKVEVGLSDHWYSTELPKLTDSIGAQGLQVVVGWLESYERISQSFTEMHDFTTMRRSQIGIRNDGLPDIEQTLIDVVRDLSTLAFLADPAGSSAYFATLNMQLIWRIALHAAAESLTRGLGEGGDLGKLRVAALELLFVPVSTDPVYVLEFARLLRTLAELQAISEGETESLIKNGPFGSEAGVREYLRPIGGGTYPMDEDVREITDSWQHRVISAVGNQLLPPVLTTRSTELEGERGILVSPLEPHSFSGGWIGPESAFTSDQLSSFTSGEIMSLLEKWHPLDSWRGPSHEGLGRELTALVSREPDALVDEDNLIDRLRPTYVRAILWAWESAIRSGAYPQWDQVLALVSGVLAHEIESPFEQEGRRFDDDEDYFPARHAAIRLIEEATRPRSEHPVPDLVVGALASIILSDDGIARAYTDYAANALRDSMDPLTISLNRSWPMALRALLNLISHGDRAGWFAPSLAAFEREIFRTDPNHAHSAVVGEGLAKLYLYARSWLDGHISVLFGSAQSLSVEPQIALATSLVTFDYHPEFFDILRDSITSALNLPEAMFIGTSGRSDVIERVGQWVLEAHLTGHISDSDPLLLLFFERSSPEDRRKAIDTITWRLNNTESVDPDFVARLALLWDSRVEHVRAFEDDAAELAGFQWFVHSGKFDPEWWLPRILEIVEVAGRMETHGMLGEALSVAASSYPRMALDVLVALLRPAIEPELNHWDLLDGPAATVIARALTSGDPQLEKRALGFMHELGAKGQRELKEQVEAVLDATDI